MKAFREWLAIEVAGAEDTIWPATVTFDPTDGIRIETVSFGAAPEPPEFSSRAITGYLDYQQPVTFLENFVHSRAGMTLAAGHLLRSKYGIISNYMLKGMHLADADEPAFEAIVGEPSCLHRWIDYQGVSTEWKVVDGLPAPEITLRDPRKEVLRVIGGSLEVTSYNSVSGLDGNYPVEPRTRLRLDFDKRKKFSEVLALLSNIETVIGFLLGARYPAVAYSLASSGALSGEGTGRRTFAELWFSSRTKTAKPDQQPMFNRTSAGIPLQTLFDFCVGRTNAHLIYKMGVVLAHEMNDVRVDEGYVELLGTLEDLDGRLNGVNGPDGLPLSLKQRLERLQRPWKADGFRGSPSITKIVRHRNIKPHGRGHDLSPQHFQFMYTVSTFLTALLRYHLSRVLGMDAETIDAGFRRAFHRYGVFSMERKEN